MNVFTKKLNPLTGAVEWVMQNENYDFNQEIARSAFADMLHDSERNEKYYTAIKKVIEQTHRAGKKAHVLDIGTGTGLLAMMAARCGADTIHACEAFSPISQCAEEVIRENGLVDRIRVIHKRSTEMTAGDGGDIPHRANILVTEVFDTELIGEGAIATFNHAHKHLLEKDCLVVPTSGTVYAQVVESAVMQRWNRLDPWGALKLCGAVAMCPGAAAVHDLQLSQLKLSDFSTIAPPQPVFRIFFAYENFENKEKCKAILHMKNIHKTCPFAVTGPWLCAYIRSRVFEVSSCGLNSQVVGGGNGDRRVGAGPWLRPRAARQSGKGVLLTLKDSSVVSMQFSSQLAKSSSILSSKMSSTLKKISIGIQYMSIVINVIAAIRFYIQFSTNGIAIVTDAIFPFHRNVFTHTK
ncbi:Protein arginine N-methyltransferase 7 [Homalodisca vitripennis]|nr:Protein arginine N-methyltransferase 7 [Homalodisca vitripennis]